MLSAAARKLLLVLHVGASVGAMGAVAAFMALAAIGATTADLATLAAAYPAMDVIARLVILPLLVVAFGVGLIQSLTTPWGLFRHWWVLAKLALTLVILVVLVLQYELLASLADAARSGIDLAAPGYAIPRLSPLLHSAGGLAALLATLVLSIYKPRGLTRYGWHRLHQRAAQ